MANDAHHTPHPHKRRLADDSAGLVAVKRHEPDNQKSPEEMLRSLAHSYKLERIKVFPDAKAAVMYATELYDTACQVIIDSLQEFADGVPSVQHRTQHATYPFIGLYVDVRHMDRCRGKYSGCGVVKEPGFYGITVTRLDVFTEYLTEQLGLLVAHYEVPVLVAASDTPIPLPFVVNTKAPDISARHQYELRESFTLPDLTKINDLLPNGTSSTNLPLSLQGVKPMSLFNAERVDLSLQRLAHYCGTSPKLFQGFVLLTNYQRYIDEFIAWGCTQVHDATNGFDKLVGPHDTLLADVTTGVCVLSDAASSLPQMPAYHLTRPDGLGITMVNIGVGPSNAKTLSDHLAVLRPHCWLMLGHCAGLRLSQNLGDYVLAHAYVREDHVLDQDLPLWVPLPPIAEVQTALQEAVASVLEKAGVAEVKSAVRTGTLVTTDDRDWELKATELRQRFKQARAIAVDMESATIAANGFRFRCPYGTLLCVSDKPIHGELKLQGMANEFYRQRTAEHLKMGLEAIRLLREQGVGRLQSRKLRGFAEPPFR